MGADLILTFCPVPSYDDGHVVQTFTQPDEGKYEFTRSPEGERVRAEFIARVLALSDEQIAQAMEDAYPGDPDVADPEESVSRFIAAFDDVFLVPTRRDVTDLCIGGRWYVFTGGMTWGDTPTDAYDEVNLLSCFDLLSKPFGPNPASTP